MQTDERWLEEGNHGPFKYYVCVLIILEALGRLWSGTYHPGLTQVFVEPGSILEQQCRVAAWPSEKNASLGRLLSDFP